MNEIFQRLSSIESAASSIQEQAAAKKKAMAEAQTKRIQEFDAALTISTEKQISDQKAKLQSQIESQLTAQREELNSRLAQMDQDYNENHTDIAKQLLAKLTKE